MNERKDTARGFGRSASRPPGGRGRAGASEPADESAEDLRRLLEGLDVALASLRRELTDLPIALAAQLPPRESETGARNEVLTALERIEERTAALRAEVSEGFTDRIEQVESAVLAALRSRDDVDRLGTTSLLRRIEELRDALDRRDVGDGDPAAAGIGASVAAARIQAADLAALREILAEGAEDAVSRVSELVDRVAARQQDALGVLELAATRVEASQSETRARFDELLSATLAALESSNDRARQVAREQAEQVQQALGEVRSLLADAHAFSEVGVGQVQTAVEDIRSSLAVSAGDVRAAFSESEGLLREILRDTRTAATGSVDEARRLLEDNGTTTRATLKEATDSVLFGLDERLESLRGWMTEAPQRLSAVLATHSDQTQGSTEQLGREVATLADQIRSGARHEVDRLTESVTAARTALADMGSAATADLEQRLAETRSALEQAVRWLESALAEQTAAVSAAERARAAADEAAARQGRELSEHVLAVRDAATQAATVAGGVEGSVEDLRRAVSRVGADLSTEVGLALRSSAAEELRQLAEAVTSVQGSMEAAAAAVHQGMQERLEAVDSLAGEMTSQIRGELAASVAEDRDRVRAALGELEASARGVASGLSATIVDHLETMRSASAADLVNLTSAARSVRQAVEDIGRQVGDAIAESEAGTRGLTERLGDRLAALAESARLAGEAGTEEIEAAMSRLRVEMAQVSADTRLSVEAVAGRLEAVVAEQARSSTDAAAHVIDSTRSIAQSTSALRRAADDLTPALEASVDDIVSGLRETAAADRVQWREGLDGIRETAERISADFESSLARHAAEARETNAADLAGLKTSVDDVKTLLAQQLDEARSASLAEVASLKQSVAETKSVIAGDLHELQLIVDEVVGRLEAAMAKQTATIRRKRGDESD